nr:MAG TPA: hypothetical protein [Caudoviricetes sp.]
MQIPDFRGLSVLTIYNQHLSTLLNLLILLTSVDDL